MSKFKVILIAGIGLGVLAGGTVALFMSGKKTASTSTSAPSQPSPEAALSPAPAPAAAPSAAPPQGSAQASPTETEPVAASGQPKAVGRSTASGNTSDKASSIEEAARLGELGKIELYAGRYEAASRLYERSLAMHPTPLVQFSLATAYFQQGIFDKTIALCKRLLASEPAASSWNVKSAKLLAKVREMCAAREVKCVD